LNKEFATQISKIENIPAHAESVFRNEKYFRFSFFSNAFFMKISELKIKNPTEKTIDFLLNLEMDQNVDESFYNKLIILKRNKRKRIIHEPIESLKKVQRSLLNLIYDSVEYKRNLKHKESALIFKHMKNGLIRGVTAYRPKSSVIRNAHFHKNQELILKLDINNFFGTVSEKLVYDFWRNFWSNPWRKPETDENPINFSTEEIHQLTLKCVQLTCLNQCLPQGAPTSGYLANCVLDEFDKILLTYCSLRNLNYSRYSDDITISGKKRSSKEISKIISFVRFHLKEFDFELHVRKTRVLKKNNRQIVTGIVTNEKLAVPRLLKKSIRQEVYYLLKFSESHVNRHHSNIQKYLNRLSGKVNWILQVEKDNYEFSTYKSKLNSIKNAISENHISLAEACENFMGKTEEVVMG
jgi:RNA-directed DNA polymerase